MKPGEVQLSSDPGAADLRMLLAILLDWLGGEVEITDYELVVAQASRRITIWREDNEQVTRVRIEPRRS